MFIEAAEWPSRARRVEPARPFQADERAAGASSSDLQYSADLTSVSPAAAP